MLYPVKYCEMNHYKTEIGIKLCCNHDNKKPALCCNTGREREREVPEKNMKRKAARVLRFRYKTNLTKVNTQTLING